MGVDRRKFLMGAGGVTGGFLVSAALPGSAAAQEAAAQVGSGPVNWDLDPWLPAEGNSAQRLSIPSLTQPFYNTVLDVHATISVAGAELVFSTNGNWHSALRRLLAEHLFVDRPSALTSNLITTSPPVSLPQMRTGILKVGNVMYVDAQPHIVVAPGAELNELASAGFLTGPRTNVISTYGNVILKRRGDQKIRTFWDLRKIRAGQFASSDPAEGGSYTNYRSTVLNLARNYPRDPALTPQQIEQEAQALLALLFDTSGVATIGAPMHRSVPHMIATGQADAGLFFYHLAVTAMRENPGLFSAVYLSSDRTGETDDPDELAAGAAPLAGNQAGTFAVSRTTRAVNTEQAATRERLFELLGSPAFTAILAATGLRRPT